MATAGEQRPTRPRRAAPKAGDGSPEATGTAERAAGRAAPASAARVSAATKAATAKATAKATVKASAKATAKASGGATSAAATASPAPAADPLHPATLAIDVGGTGLKASVLGTDGRLLADRVRVPTTYPCAPEKMVEDLVGLVAPLPAAERVSVGFPGVVRKGRVLTAPHFVTKSGPGSAVVPELVTKWRGFDLAAALSAELGLPVRVANDADLQGWAVVSGHGLEMVVTLGTGVGSALFMDGHLAPHLELAHHPFRRGETYNEQIGDAALHDIGKKEWRRRVLKAIANFETLVNYDRLYLGGGNARLMAGHLEDSVEIVDNVAGILGGIKLWEHAEHH